MSTVKVYDCKSCKKTMMVEVSADEKTTLEIMKQNPYCNDCEKERGEVIKSGLCPDCDGISLKCYQAKQAEIYQAEDEFYQEILDAEKNNEFNIQGVK
tara:strand:- start:124 stop:417 length:294 start_codon:yes stop_codon:yes gene_type:complete